MAADPIEFQPLSALRIDVESERDRKVIVRCQGQLVRETASELNRAVKPLLGKSSHVVLDLRGVRKIDSSGLGAVIALEGTASEMGLCRIELCGASSPVQELLRRTNTLSAFNWVEEEAANTVLESRRETIGDELRRNPDSKFREVD